MRSDMSDRSLNTKATTVCTCIEGQKDELMMRTLKENIEAETPNVISMMTTKTSVGKET